MQATKTLLCPEETLTQTAADAPVRFFSGREIPLEMHKVRVVQKLNLLPPRQRLAAMEAAGYNTFLLKSREVFLDMLTDSGVNAMSDEQMAGFMIADDSYAGSETFYRLESALEDFFGTRYFLPAHQGRACENMLATALVQPGSAVIMNYHFTTTKSHITRNGGRVLEVVHPHGLDAQHDAPFKGDFDLAALDRAVSSEGAHNVAFVRVEAGTNLIGGQPVSLQNMRAVTALCRGKGILSVLDASLLADNLYFIKTREAGCHSRPLKELVAEIGGLFDIIYFSGRKLGCARGGGICLHSEALYDRLKELVPLFEGFLTYGGMSVREMEALRVGLAETLDMDFISQSPRFIAALSRALEARGVPVVTPSGGLGCHIDAARFVDHIPQHEYPAGALAAAIYLASGVRGMERGTLSEQREADGTEPLAQMELVRLAVPKRVFTLSQLEYAADRIGWLYEHRRLIGGLGFVREPATLRFFLGRLAPLDGWPAELIAAFEGDMPGGR